MGDKKDNIIGLETKPDQVKAAVEIMKRNLPELIAHAKAVAEVKRAYFLALKEQGFAEGEALFLCQFPISI